MTKSNMIEVLITDTLEHREKMKRFERWYGDDSKLAKRARTEWAALHEIICKFGLEKQYIDEVNATRNA